MLSCFSIWFYFNSNGLASNVLTTPIEKNMIFTIFFILINLPLYYVFQAPLSLWDFFQLNSTFHLKIGTCTFNIMLNNIFNFHTPWDSQNPYNPRLNKKQALWPSFFKKKLKTSTSNIIISYILMK
jgi:hypothetical protein